MSRTRAREGAPEKKAPASCVPGLPALRGDTSGHVEGDVVPESAQSPISSYSHSEAIYADLADQFELILRRAKRRISKSE